MFRRGFRITTAAFLSFGFLAFSISAPCAEKMTESQKETARILSGTAKDRANDLASRIREKKMILEELRQKDPSSQEAQHLRIEIRDLRKLGFLYILNFGRAV